MNFKLIQKLTHAKILSVKTKGENVYLFWAGILLCGKTVKTVTKNLNFGANPKISFLSDAKKVEVPRVRFKKIISVIIKVRKLQMKEY